MPGPVHDLGGEQAVGRAVHQKEPDAASLRHIVSVCVASRGAVEPSGGCQPRTIDLAGNGGRDHGGAAPCIKEILLSSIAIKETNLASSLETFWQISAYLLSLGRGLEILNSGLKPRNSTLTRLITRSVP